MKPKLGFLGLGLACAACCAPLFIPLLTGTGLATAFTALTFDAVLCGALAIAALALFAYWLRTRNASRKAASCGCEKSCDVAAGCGPK